MKKLLLHINSMYTNLTDVLQFSGAINVLK